MIFQDDRTYDVLKWIALILLPAVAALYSTLAGIWSLPYADAVPRTIMAIDTFLGVILQISSDKYANSKL